MKSVLKTVRRAAYKQEGFRALYLPAGLLLWFAISVAAFIPGRAYIGKCRAERLTSTLVSAGAAADALAQAVEGYADAMETVQDQVRIRQNLLAGGDSSAAATVADYLVRLCEAKKFGIVQVSAIGADGWVTWSSAGSTPIWLGDRDYFLAHKNGERGPYLSKPISGDDRDGWDVQFTRPLVKPDGSFGGVAVVTFDPRQLSSILKDLRFGDQSVSMIRTLPTGSLIASSNDVMVQQAVSADMDPAVAAVRTAPSGILHGPDTTDGPSEFQAYRMVGHLPLIAVIDFSAAKELNEVEVLEDWVDVIWVALTLMLAAILTIMARRGVRQRSLMESELVRKEATMAEKAHTQVALLLSGLPAAVYALNLAPDGRVIDFTITETAHRLTGWDLEDVMSRQSWASKAQDIEDSEWRDYFRRVIEDGEASIEYRFPHKSGSTVWFRDQARVVERRPFGEVSVVGYVSDITRERTIQAQAFTSSKLATLGEMATGLAHELNQPIATISLAAENAAQMLERKGDEGIPFAVQRMSRIVEQSARARTIINHLRIFGRQSKEGLGPVQLGAIVDGALALVANALRWSGVTVDVQLPDGLPAVDAEIVLAEHVVVNIVLNARDAMESNPPDRLRTLTIKATHDDAAGTIMLSIHDNGPGVPASLLDRIFEPFFTTKAIGKGTGLGLSLCHGIMTSFGGGISVRNVPDGGAEFVTTFRYEPIKSEPMAGTDIAHVEAV